MGKIGANSYKKGDYDNKPACGLRKNKANSKFTLSAVEWANIEQKIAAALRASQ
jgi:hypothetical protein